MKRSKEAGFTSIEIMVALLISAVLAAVALPAYAKHMASTRRAEAYLGLGTIVRMQDQYYEQNGRYARTIDELGFQMDRGGLQGDNTWQGKTYRFSITPLDDDAQYYTATATGNLDGDVFDDILVVYK